MKKIIASVFLSMTLIMSILTISAHANELKLTELEGITQEEVTEETDDEPVQELFTMPDEESENILLDRNKDRSNWIDLEENRQELPEEILEAMGKNSSDDGLKMGTFTTENRPGSNFQNAVTGFSNKVVKQGFEEAEIGHYYKFEMYSGQDYSFILTNLSADYDVYLSDMEYVWGVPQTGTTSEQFYLTADKTGTYYVIVLHKGEIAASNYFLYFGDFIRSGRIQYDPKISHSFTAYNPPGSGQYPPPPHKYSQYYIIDFANNSRVPGNSLITRLSIDANTDGYWSGFYQDVMFAQDQSEIITKSANISIIVNVPQDEQPEYWAKQQIAIRGHVMKCDFFTWRPTVDMSYIYGMDLDNLWYLVQNGH